MTPANIRNSRLRAHVRVDALVEPAEDAAERGEGGAEIHTRRMIFAVSMPVAEARSPLSLTGTGRLAEPRPLQHEGDGDQHDAARATVIVKSRGVIATGPKSQATWLL